MVKKDVGQWEKRCGGYGKKVYTCIMYIHIMHLFYGNGILCAF